VRAFSKNKTPISTIQTIGASTNKGGRPCNAESCGLMFLSDEGSPALGVTTRQLDPDSSCGRRPP